jgi:hypothetical protein
VRAAAVRRVSLAALLAGAAAASAAAQQRQPFPPRPLPAAAVEAAPLSFTLSQSLEAATNYELVDDPAGNTYYGETRAAVDWLRDTETSRFALGLDTGLRGVDHPDDDFEWVAASPSLAYLDYRGEGVDTLFDVGLTARSRIVDSTTTVLIEGDPTDPDIPDTLDQVRLDAREYRYDADVGFTGGTTSPSTWGVRLLANTYDYDETASNLTPRTTVNPQANWRLQLTPVFSGVLFGGYYYYNADNVTETEIRVAETDAGVIYEPSDVLRLGFGLGYADRRREETRAGVREEVEHETGPVLRGDLRYVLPDLTLAGTLRWTTAAAEDNRFSGSLGGFYTLPRGLVTGRIYQRAVGDSTGNEVRVTGATIGLEREINTASRIGLDFGWATQVSLEDDDEPDITRTDFVVSYAYDLTAAVTAEVGYNYETRDEDPVNADNHRVFLVLGRTFETGL